MLQADYLGVESDHGRGPKRAIDTADVSAQTWAPSAAITIDKGHRHMRAALLVLLLLAPGARAADALVCPDLAAAVQIGSCPSEAELRYAFTAVCSDDARVYAKDTDECTDFQQYRRRRNTALWESADGRFQSYLSCELPVASVRNAKAAGISVEKQGNVVRLVCGYPQGISFVHRSKGQCRIEGDGNCKGSPSACVARCD